ncbi:hypothetical protein ACI77J_01170 [Pseudomonas sp. O64]|uniref:hypothetical protein n=1 Tax=unclassified Pseudomonas TaxID=196821 RepID=UPI00387B1519
MNLTKFKPVELASKAFYTSRTFAENETTFKHGSAKAIIDGQEEEISTKHLLITEDRNALPNVEYILRDYFASSQYQDATHKKFHIIDLDTYDYDTASIRLIKTHLFKPVSSISKCETFARAIDAGIASTNNIELESFYLEAFRNMMQPYDFFKFEEVRTEFRISVTLVKNGKALKPIKMNMGYFTLIVGSKPYDYQEEDSKQKKATRPSLSNPIYKVGDIEFMATFNDRQKRNRDAVDMVRI